MVRVAPPTRPGLSFAVTPDFLELGEAEVFARAMARWQPSDYAAQLLADQAADARAGQEFLDLFGIVDARLWDPISMWQRVTGADRLRIPLGKTPAGKVVWLDFKEGAEGGVGPHGMLTGQTGSGKSEHLKAIVLTLCMMFPPDQVQVLLGDFKGESAFAGLEHLPHVQGVVSNLAKSLHKLDRLEDVIRGEVQRREELLNATGYKDVRDYETARATTKPHLEPIGALLIVADEFSELLAIRPDMAKVFEHVGLVGRALWIHILNASQRVESGKMAGLLPQQTYSIGMKVKDASQSRAAIGSARAYEDLKRAPKGSAFLVVDDEHTRYRSFYVSAPFVEPKPQGLRAATEGHFVEAHPFTAAPTALPGDVLDDVTTAAAAAALAAAEEEQGLNEPGVDAPTLLSVLADRVALTGTGHRLPHRLWLPPLEDTTAIPIDELAREFWGREWYSMTADAGLVVPYAREDDPFGHSQNVVGVDLSGAGGNIGVAGATQAGKSTALRTLMMMLAVSHSPQRVQFYGIDLGGGNLSSVAALPHVSGLTGRGNEAKMRRIIAEIERLLRFRERAWEQADINLPEFRARKFGTAPGSVPDDGHGDVFLIIDNLNSLRTEFTDLHDRVLAMAEGALNYGIHLMVANDSWLQLSQKLSSKLGTRIELRMANPIDSEIRNKDAARAVPDQPGRGLQRNARHMLIGVPAATQFGGPTMIQDTAAAIADVWARAGVARAPELPVLPMAVQYRELAAVGPDRLALGIGENGLETVAIDLTRTQHFYALGRSETGRSTVLRTLLTSITLTYTPEQAEVVVFDPNFALADLAGAAHVKVYANTVSQVSAAATAIAQKLAERRPPANMAPAELARWRSTAPKLFIVVDDLNQLSAMGTTQSALLPLAPAIEIGPQLGLHVLAATQADRWHAIGPLNKVIQAMSAARPAVLIMDSDKSEKIFEDVRGAPQVPGRGNLVSRGVGAELVQVALPASAEENIGVGAG